jgi:hypothetical protein
MNVKPIAIGTTLAALLLAPWGLLRADPTVALVEGQAMVKFADSQEWEPLEADMPLETGDRLQVKENSRVEVAGDGGDVWEVEENTEMEVGSATPELSSFKLWLGGLLAKITPRANNKFEVRTPLAVAAVRGTEFAVDVDKDGASEVGVTEGSVALKPLDPALGEELLLTSQEGGAMRPRMRPARLRGFPPRVQRHLLRMQAFRGRAPMIRAKWRSLAPAQRREIRQNYRERFKRASPQKQPAKRNMHEQRRQRQPQRTPARKPQ